jgi:hypothetical protein
MRQEFSAVKRASALPGVPVSRSLRLRGAKASALNYLFRLPHREGSLEQQLAWRSDTTQEGLPDVAGAGAP